MKIGTVTHTDANGKKTVRPTFTIESQEDLDALFAAVEAGKTAEEITALVEDAEKTAAAAIDVALRAFRTIDRQIVCLRGNNNYMTGEAPEALIVGLIATGQEIQRQVTSALAQLGEAEQQSKAARTWRATLQRVV